MQNAINQKIYVFCKCKNKSQIKFVHLPGHHNIYDYHLASLSAWNSWVFYLENIKHCTKQSIDMLQLIPQQINTSISNKVGISAFITYISFLRACIDSDLLISAWTQM